ncbi:bifunctional diaminohydroxyphosphoribosylaminopyrimidine deaminase/5-amino-6-(5-phosphoribosylamino)uracil reductase RibD [Shewanella sp. LC6]|jgi:diaminohydroxyphosphoribosylaminopyrimidine deaminase/5-amino-6-(5-phosphoribosylamino)uracil reductase|uniref:bifunctional diaminohydroxyphosphoribosylaminopyrimidine deaminase/5-amino-6-(5-phosphoribosylamino)uracil reductase RibD n=1 Tax=Shewanella TaxID=22 RepID=UPI0006DBD50E|nr:MULTISPECIES: bifunctional diaminohydroxyphosphoribosylaminopyrimidine deaminase/5-amino-6-(5-phosphoribosylamino)uracil reductase RibD [unclassified Shewanella]KPN75407.1 riboflavin biosynthesis protein RibD [Shewanella sp. Sh95]QQK59107.1 bifunctional diaminohydroxyphosphoribosylaminopyrimidine deaminase/5-amino-6-(5-phosphoribosylamino)uracil reductase RibD [Shewanella sp. LC6]TPE64871.1 bifunctional diaminohydroxyphosphoribosylaminopyrimidine deaminase/5-amino-6-(5-phosphoribosylamino)ura
MNWSELDNQMMSRAIQLARKGFYTTRPNPSVGCVIVKDNQIVGEGYHQKAGEPHAEVHALRMAGELARGATAYVTLEPCSHYGRTPPCALALINIGVKRVVVAVEDPNPQVGGRGIQMLRDAGIQVDVGLHRDEAYALNLGFMKRMESGLPWVTVKLAASLDGKTALSNGVSKWITGPEARRDVQRLRLRACAIVTGIETVLADDPSLNVRYSELGSLNSLLSEAQILQPLRVILDSRCRMPIKAALLAIESPILLVSTEPYSPAFMAQLPSHVTCLQLPAIDGRISLPTLLSYLGKNCNQVLIEAGATLAGAFIGAGLADELVLYQAMKILGAQGRNLLELPDYQMMADIPTLKLVDERKVGADTRFTLRLTSNPSLANK